MDYSARDYDHTHSHTHTITAATTQLQRPGQLQCSPRIGVYGHVRLLGEVGGDLKMERGEVSLSVENVP